RSETRATYRFPLLPNPMGDCVYPFPLNAGFASKAFQTQVKSEGTPLPERPDILIVAAPRQAKLQALVLVGHAQPVAHRGPAVGERQRVFGLAGEVDDARSEHRPVARELHPAGDAQFLFVPQILNGRVDVAVEAKIADLGIGLVRPDGEIELVAPEGQVVLVDPVTMSDVDEPPEADPSSSNNV